MSCPSVNDPATGEDCFLCADGIHWDDHRIGWAIAGGCAALVRPVLALSRHNFPIHHPLVHLDDSHHIVHLDDARHALPTTYGSKTGHEGFVDALRVSGFPPASGLLPSAVFYDLPDVSFLSYRYYRSYEYYVLPETAYEAITLSAFLMLLMELVALNTNEKEISTALARKDKRKMPFPFNCFRFRASKPYFMHTLSFSVMQYVIIRPLISIIGIICEYYNVLCPQKYSVHFAEAYLDSVDFVSISFALYGLIVFYILCKDELRGRRPLAKFLAIKLIVFFTFYQSFVFSVLQDYNVIKASSFWTADNVVDGLSALCTTIEMVFFSIFMGWAYLWTDYTNPVMNPYQRPTGVKTYFQAIWDTINLSDFAFELYYALKFFVDFVRGKPGTHAESTKLQRTFMPHTIGNGQMTKGQVAFATKGIANTQHRGMVDTNNTRPEGFSDGLPLRSYDSYRRIMEESGGNRNDSGPFETNSASEPTPSQYAGYPQPRQLEAGYRYPDSRATVDHRYRNQENQLDDPLVPQSFPAPRPYPTSQSTPAHPTYPASQHSAQTTRPIPTHGYPPYFQPYPAHPGTPDPGPNYPSAAAREGMPTDLAEPHLSEPRQRTDPEPRAPASGIARTEWQDALTAENARFYE
ncbi:MAG: hypothetical protein TREMPRED_004830 [Tremellales sp. Tagirdzhanova-0007]|nr:MAG: hypothetical protein TREMPRED_004830 [Tremellales sp. Tagirdzhanova-0007]